MKKSNPKNSIFIHMDEMDDNLIKAANLRIET
jgi:hypothetical protein